jgi:hypothetical protein
MTGHLDADTLAEYREGLLGRRRSARIRAHLSGCSHCSAADRDLAEVTTLLAAAPAPRMPDELASRLQGVLAAEAAARTTAPSQAQEQPAQRAADQDGRRRARPTRAPHRRRVLALRVASATAVVAVLAAVGIDLAHNSGGSNVGSGSSGAGAPALAPGHSSAARAAGPDMVPNHASGGSSISVAGGTVPVLHSGRDYQRASLAAQARAELGSYAARASALPGSVTGGTNQSVSTVQGCVRRATGGVQPTLVDQARYQGQRATVIVQAPAATRPGQVWVTGAGCSATHPDLLAHASLAAAG